MTNQEFTQVKASLQVLARAAVACIVGGKLRKGTAYDNLLDALNLPRVQDALKAKPIIYADEEPVARRK